VEIDRAEVDTMSDVHPDDSRASAPIARIWRGVVREEDANDYRDSLRADVLDVRSTEGNAGVLVLERRRDGRSEFLFVSLWDSIESIARFAGADVDRAVYFRDDARVLIDPTDRVEHYDIVESELDRR
jgi:heme-degrading monooxygenase HmoA